MSYFLRIRQSSTGINSIEYQNQNYIFPIITPAQLLQMQVPQHLNNELWYSSYSTKTGREGK